MPDNSGTLTFARLQRIIRQPADTEVYPSILRPVYWTGTKIDPATAAIAVLKVRYLNE